MKTGGPIPRGGPAGAPPRGRRPAPLPQGKSLHAKKRWMNGWMDPPVPRSDGPSSTTTNPTHTNTNKSINLSGGGRPPGPGPAAHGVGRHRGPPHALWRHGQGGCREGGCCFQCYYNYVRYTHPRCVALKRTCWCSSNRNRSWRPPPPSSRSTPPSTTPSRRAARCWRRRCHVRL